MSLDELIKALQELKKEHGGDLPVEFVLHSHFQASPTVYMRVRPYMYKSWDNAIRITLQTGEDVRISILNKKIIAHVSD